MSGDHRYLRGTQLPKAISTKFNVHFFVLLYNYFFSEHPFMSVEVGATSWHCSTRGRLFGVFPSTSCFATYFKAIPYFNKGGRRKISIQWFQGTCKAQEFRLGYIERLVCVYIKALSRSIKLYYDEQQIRNRKHVPCFYQVLVEFSKYTNANAAIWLAAPLHAINH